MLLVFEKPPDVARPTKKPAKRRAEYLNGLLEKKQLARKNERSRHYLYLSAGLFLSMVLVTLAFQWKQYQQPEVELQALNETVEDLLDIPVTQQPPPPPPKQTVQQPSIIEVPDEEEIMEEIQVDFDIDITAEESMEAVDYSAIQGAPEEEKAEEIFTIVEKSPEPAMGMEAFLKYLYENINYPQSAINLRVQGRVFIQFIVNTDGTLTDFTVLRGIGAGCDEEAVRVLREAAPWIPGKQRGKPVRVKMVLPVQFVYKERL